MGCPIATTLCGRARLALNIQADGRHVACHFSGKQELGTVNCLLTKPSTKMNLY